MPDAESFDDFYRTTRARTCACIYALTGDLAEAQDATQEAYIRAWERWRNVGEYADPEAWVRTVAWRVAASQWRKATSRRGYGSIPGQPRPRHAPLL